MPKKHETLADVVREGWQALIQLTNSHDSNCHFCDGPTYPNGSGHKPTCIVERLGKAAAGIDSMERDYLSLINC